MVNDKTEDDRDDIGRMVGFLQPVSSLVALLIRDGSTTALPTGVRRSVSDTVQKGPCTCSLDAVK